MIKNSKKSQTLILQFILFFIIGFSVFLIVGNFFRLQSNIFGSDINDYALKLTNSYISGNAILMFDCKGCDYSFINFSTKMNTRPDFIFEIKMSRRLLNTSLVLTSKYDISSIHRINESVTFVGKASTSKPLTLTINKTKNELRVD